MSESYFRSLVSQSLFILKQSLASQPALTKLPSHFQHINFYLGILALISLIEQLCVGGKIYDSTFPRKWQINSASGEAKAISLHPTRPPSRDCAEPVGKGKKQKALHLKLSHSTFSIKAFLFA